MHKIENVPYVIFAACVLHNFILQHSSDADSLNDFGVSENDVDDEINDIVYDNQPAQSAVDKRLQIAQLLM